MDDLAKLGLNEYLQNGRVSLLQADITCLKTDAIVNAANSSLLGGGGVDGAIHQAAGYQLLDECRTLGGCPTGMAKITKAYKLPSKYVIHTVGPVWQGGTKNEKELLSSCYMQSLFLAKKYELQSLAFPSISTGVFRFPKNLAAEIALLTTCKFLKNNLLPEKVLFVVFDNENLEAYERLFESF